MDELFKYISTFHAAFGLLAVVIIVYTVDKYVFGYPEKINGIPEVPGWPIIGNIHQVVNDASKVYLKWSKEYGELYQIRSGVKRVVVANSYDSIRILWLDHRSANNSRPTLHTFHNVVSKTQGFTIGTTPYGEAFKKRKKLVATFLNKKSVGKLDSLIDEETALCLTTLDHQRKCSDNNEIYCLNAIQGFVLKIALYITFNFKIDYSNELGLGSLQEITEVESQIINLRSHTSHLQDFVPLFKILSGSLNQKAESYRDRRDEYMDYLFNQLKKKIALERLSDVDCLVSRAWELNNSFVGDMGCKSHSISPDDLKSVCLTMVSAGLDNTPLNFCHCLGHLSQKCYGQEIQDLALEQILNEYGTLQAAWDRCPYDGIKVDYVMALIKETLRHLSVMPLSLPRETTQDIRYKDTIIPKGTLLFMNNIAGNYDDHYFPDPNRFEPKRWLGPDSKFVHNGTNLQHFSFGLGSRMCAGSHLAYKELYVLLIRTLIKYRISAPEDEDMLMETDILKLNQDPSAITIVPKKFLVKLLPRVPVEESN